MDPWRTYGLTFLAFLFLSWVLLHALYYAKARSAGEGAIVGFMNWLGFAATVMGITNRFGHQPWMLWGIDSGYQLVNFVLAGIILTLWHKKLWDQAQAAGISKAREG